jgi:hypothetical protein
MFGLENEAIGLTRHKNGRLRKIGYLCAKGMALAKGMTLESVAMIC